MVCEVSIKIEHYGRKDIQRGNISILESYPLDYLRMDRIELTSAPVAIDLHNISPHEINRYADDDPDYLKDIIRKTEGLGDDIALLFGNGASEIIQMVMLAGAKEGGKVLAAEPSFFLYKKCAKLFGLEYLSVNLSKDFEISEKDFLDAILTHKPSIIFISYPNNPTSNLFSFESILQIIRCAPGVVVIDETYHHFSRRSFIDLVPHYANLLVIRSLSKVGYAGIRFGYVAGRYSCLEYINKVRPLFNVSTLTQHCARHVFMNYGKLQAVVEQTIAEREWLMQALRGIPGVKVVDSKTNFILFTIREEMDSNWLRERLLDDKIVVGRLDNVHPLLRGYLGVTVRSNEHNTRLLEAIRRQCVHADSILSHRAD